MVRVAGHRDDQGQLVQLGQAIRNRRKAAGLSQEALADAAEIDRSHMGKIERGERNVSVLNILKIAAALGCHASALFIDAGM